MYKTGISGWAGLFLSDHTGFSSIDLALELSGATAQGLATVLWLLRSCTVGGCAWSPPWDVIFNPDPILPYHNPFCFYLYQFESHLFSGLIIRHMQIKSDPASSCKWNFFSAQSCSQFIFLTSTALLADPNNIPVPLQGFGYKNGGSRVLLLFMRRKVDLPETIIKIWVSAAKEGTSIMKWIWV